MFKMVDRKIKEEIVFKVIIGLLFTDGSTIS